MKDLHTLSVRITERDGEYLWCGQKFSETNGEDASDGCYFIDTAGFIFSKSPNFSGPIYLKFFGGNFDSDSSDPIGRQFLDFFSFSQYIELIDSLKKLGIRPYALYIDENGDTNIYIAPITGGKKFYTKLVFSSKDTFEKSLQNLDAALQTEPLKTDFVKKFSTLLYIDLRFNNKVFYKFE